MNVNKCVRLCTYSYDALDRLTAQVRDAVFDNKKQFYSDDLLVTVISNAEICSFFRAAEFLLGYQKFTAKEVGLLCVDQQNTALANMSRQELGEREYTAYGYDMPKAETTHLLGFTGAYRDALTGGYFLGNGYRAYNPVLMRFNSPDSLSSFGEGGINAYAYCKNDPVNFQDNNGHNPWSTISKVLVQGMKTFKTSSARSVAVDKVFSATSKTGGIVPPGYELVGYHGSKSKHIANLAGNGLDPSFIGSNVGTMFGPGFYTTPDIRVARAYAKPSERFNGIGFKRPNSVGAVYVKDLSSKIPGKDFHYVPAQYKAVEQMVLRQSMYQDVLVVPVRSFKASKRPASFYGENALSIRAR